ncbi:cupredoxin domain-containing protein [Streptomyces sp. NPDC047002]|uniref:cupredoxin domain-containing protein n=1 Tax=Streptomyces sp. NPDC047002 TaxID=3155475 RepID=UPI00345600B3
MPLPPRTVRPRLAAALAVGALAVAGCSGGGGGGGASPSARPPSASSAPAAGGHTITVDDFRFAPSRLTVKAGTRITVTNKDTTAHTVTGTGSGKFDTGHIAPGRTASFTAPRTAGSYPFDCSIHPFMKGTLTVN